MFGHNDDHKDEDVTTSTVVAADTTDDSTMPVTSQPVDDMTSAIDALAAENEKTDDGISEPTTAPAAVATPVDDMPTDSSSGDDNAATTAAPAGNDELLNLKRDALESLAPLVGHLDQSPEDKFKTTMMMIQATDDSSLVKDAYEAANKIEDEKVRAQALLDIVNEINYFTQQHSS